MQLASIQSFIFAPLSRFSQWRAQSNHAAIEAHLLDGNLTGGQLEVMTLFQTLLCFSTHLPSGLNFNFFGGLGIRDNRTLAQTAAFQVRTDLLPGPDTQLFGLFTTEG